MDIANQTLLATTQLSAGDIDMDQREISRMNRRKGEIPIDLEEGRLPYTHIREPATEQLVGLV